MSDKKKIVLTALITAVVTAFISVNLTSFVKDRIAIYLPSKDENKAFSNKMTAVENMLSSNYLYDFDKTMPVMRHVPDNIFYCKGVFNGNYTANQLLILSICSSFFFPVS